MGVPDKLTTDKKEQDIHNCFSILFDKYFNEQFPIKIINPSITRIPIIFLTKELKLR